MIGHALKGTLANRVVFIATTLNSAQSRGQNYVDNETYDVKLYNRLPVRQPGSRKARELLRAENIRGRQRRPSVMPD